jgi:hypothetical protein
MHKDLTRAINDTIKDPKSIPTWLTSGITFLLSQGKDTKDPKNYCIALLCGTFLLPSKHWIKQGLVTRHGLILNKHTCTLVRG